MKSDKGKSKTKDSGGGGSSLNSKALQARDRGVRKYTKGAAKVRKATFSVSKPQMLSIHPKFANVKVKVVKAKKEDKKKKTIKRKVSKFGIMQKPTNSQQVSRTWKPFMA